MFESVRKIINWTEKYKRRMYMGFLWTFFISISVSLSIMIASYSVYRVLLDIRGEAALPSKFALWMFIAVAVSVGFRFLFTHLRMATLESISYEKTADERIEIGNVLKRVPLGYFELKKTGDITAVITTQLTLLENLGIGMINRMISGYITTGVIILYLIIFKIEVALISILGIFLSSLAIKWLYNESNRTWPIVHKAQEDMSSGTIEYIHGLSEVKTYGNENKALDTIKGAFNDSKNINIAVEKKYAPISSLHHFAIKTAICVLIFLISLLTIEGELSLFYSLMMLMFVFTMFEGVESVKDAAHGLGMIESNIKNLNSIKEAEFIDADGQDINIDKFDVEFKNVRFAYGSVDVIRDVSFKILQGSTVAIIGPSGSGKTTICNLIARFYDVQKGSIKVGNHDIRELSCDSLLKNISMVFQKVYLFHDTIENNILFGNPNASKEQIIEAAKKARCHEFIMNFPDGYETIVGDGGGTLSGGEKQRISLARAMLKNAPIVMLDEATASIDPENEHHIHHAISELTKGKTVITIAHKLSTVTNADNIIVLKDGEISEQGKHVELLKNDGIYKKFIEIREKAEGWKL